MSITTIVCRGGRTGEDIRKGTLMARALGATGKLDGILGDGEKTKSILRDLKNARKEWNFDLMEDLLLRLCGMYLEAGILPSSYSAGRSASKGLQNPSREKKLKVNSEGVLRLTNLIFVRGLGRSVGGPTHL